MPEKKRDGSAQSSGNEQKSAGARRRGDVLDAAILQAAWDELNEVGYARLTMENIAARAQTNKNAVYRRWANKSKIVAAAIGKHVPKPDTSPDTGSLRGDMLALLHGIIQPTQLIGAETIHGMMADYHGGNLIASLPELMKDRSEDPLTAAVTKILQNAEKRGEVSLSNINSRVLTLPANLLFFELLTTQEPVSEQTITGIVDDIFLPLVELKH